MWRIKLACSTVRTHTTDSCLVLLNDEPLSRNLVCCADVKQKSEEPAFKGLWQQRDFSGATNLSDAQPLTGGTPMLSFLPPVLSHVGAPAHWQDHGCQNCAHSVPAVELDMQL